MSEGLELLAVKETKNKPTKYRGARDGNADVWIMLLERHLEKAHDKATPLDKVWTIFEYLEHEARTTLPTNLRRKEISTKQSSRC